MEPVAPATPPPAERGKVAIRDGYDKVAHLYDLFDDKDNIGFFLEYGAAAGEILDIGAGTGRIAIPMAERSIRVYCVEPSSAMLRVLRRKIGSHSHLKDLITVVQADAISFDLGRTFPAAFMSGSFDHHMNDEERLGALANIARHLDPGGKLVFDVFLGLMKDTDLKPAGEHQMEGKTYRRLVRSRARPDRTMEYLLVFEIFAGDRRLERIEQFSSAGITDRKTVHRLLGLAGFAVTGEFGDYHSSPFREGDELLIVEATRESVPEAGC